MKTLNDPHLRFASLFKNDIIQPYAYLISKCLEEGSICLRLDELENKNLSNFPFENFKVDIPLLLDQKDFVSVGENLNTPFILDENRFYINRFFQYESEILQKLHQIIANDTSREGDRKLLIKKLKPEINRLFSTNETCNNLSDEECIEWQKIAAINALFSNFTILTGGPGTGKTTTVVKILALLLQINPNEKIALAAQTGKAAMRMAESIRNTEIQVSKELLEKLHNLEPFTIHRLLKVEYGTPYFKHNAENPLDYDTIVIDESSMIDVGLFFKLITAIDHKTRILFLGDKNQLASVEAGSIFGDLCETTFPLNSFKKERVEFLNSFIAEEEKKLKKHHQIENNSHPLLHRIVELKRSRRFSSKEGIGKFSKLILNENLDEINYYIENKEEKIIIDSSDQKDLFESYALQFTDYILEQDIKTALKKINKIRFLCAIREGQKGIYFINKRIEKILEDKKLISANNEFYQNRPIIVTSNNKELDLFNGDVGIIRNENGINYAFFEDGADSVKKILPALISNMETVYAMTIHKSQGSEYENVFLILPDDEECPVLSKELLYTGVTRAKQKVIIQSSLATLKNTIKKKMVRASGITHRLK